MFIFIFILILILILILYYICIMLALYYIRDALTFGSHARDSLAAHSSMQIAYQADERPY